MEIAWKWKNALLTSKILAKMKMKLYGNHMEMEKRPSDIKIISLDGNETLWKSYDRFYGKADFQMYKTLNLRIV